MVMERWRSETLEISELQASGLALKVQTPIPNRLVPRRRSTTQFKLRSSTPSLQFSTTPSFCEMTVSYSLFAVMPPLLYASASQLLLQCGLEFAQVVLRRL